MKKMKKILTLRFDISSKRETKICMQGKREMTHFQVVFIWPKIVFMAIRTEMKILMN